MAYGISIRSAIGDNNITDLSSFRVFAIETKTETLTFSPQTFTYTAPSGWTSSNGTFYILSNADGLLPSFSVSGSNTIEGVFSTGNPSIKSESFTIFWLVKTGTDQPPGYGVYIANANGETVLDNNTDTLLAESSGTLSSYITTNSGFRAFDLPANFSRTDSLVFVKLPDNADFYAISRLSPGSPENYQIGTTTEVSFEYFIVKESFKLTSSSAYGFEVYDGSGNLVYSDSYELFPSNGQTFKVEPYVSSSSTTIDTSKDLWVALNFAWPIAFCPDGGINTPTVNLVAGLERSGSLVSTKLTSSFNDPPSPQQFEAHDNTALIVQR
jgi:hypothetical protein